MNIDALHTQIKRSIETLDFIEFKTWVDKGANIHFVDNGFMCKTKGYTLLHWSLKAENLEVLTYLIGQKVNYKKKVADIGTLLDFSTDIRNEEIITFLLNLDYSDEEKKIFIENSVFHAGIFGHTAKIKFLINNEFSKNITSQTDYFYTINTKNKFGETILHLLAGNEETLDIIKLLVDKGIDIEIRDETGKTALDYAINEQNKENILYLKGIGAKGDELNTLDEISLYDAIEQNNSSHIRDYLKSGGDINIRISKEGNTKYPLLTLALNNDSDLISNILIDNNIDINLQDDSPPIWDAAIRGKLDIVKKLLEAGANINDEGGGPDEGAGTVLTSTVFYGKKEVVEYLLKAGADVNGTDSYGRTALHITRYEEDQELENLVLQFSPNLEIEDDYGVKALEIGL